MSIFQFFVFFLIPFRFSNKFCGPLFMSTRCQRYFVDSNCEMRATSVNSLYHFDSVYFEICIKSMDTHFSVYSGVSVEFGVGARFS